MEEKSATLLGEALLLPRCPRCNIANPYLLLQRMEEVQGDVNKKPRVYATYRCKTCGDLMLAKGTGRDKPATEILPGVDEFDESIPDRARRYLEDARDTMNVPSASVLMSAGAIDAMLKAKGYKTGKLYPRIKQAVKDGTLTKSMEDWAHHVRLEANEERHADEEAPPATKPEAKTCLAFAHALAQFLFVLPAMVSQGIAEAQVAEEGSNPS